MWNLCKSQWNVHGHNKLSYKLHGPFLFVFIYLFKCQLNSSFSLNLTVLAQTPIYFIFISVHLQSLVFWLTGWVIRICLCCSRLYTRSITYEMKKNIGKATRNIQTIMHALKLIFEINNKSGFFFFNEIKFDKNSKLYFIFLFTALFPMAFYQRILI